MSDMLAQMDTTIDHLIKGLEARNLYDHVHIIIVSDHGMAGSSKDHIIYWDDIVPEDLMNELEEREVWPLLAIRPKATAPKDTMEMVYNKLLNYTNQPDNTPDKSAPQSHFQVYLRGDVPQRFH